MMDNLYRDFVESNFSPDITIRKRSDNGHFEASSMGFKVTDHDQDRAVAKLQEQLHEALSKGELSPDQ